MAGGPYDSSLTRVQPFFNLLLDRDPTGESWLPALVGVAPNPEAVRRAAAGPGRIVPDSVDFVPGGLRRCFEHPVPASSALLVWFVDHPDALTWPASVTYSESTTQLRRALLYDEPPGRAHAQRLGLDLIASKSPATRGWWRFEGVSMIDCVLMTDRLVITVEGKRTEPLSAATDWYPQRSQLVRNLEAAKQLANGREWATLLISEDPIEAGTTAALSEAIPASAPHLDCDARTELAGRYLGNITWTAACSATGFAFGALPKTTADLPSSEPSAAPRRAE